MAISCRNFPMKLDYGWQWRIRSFLNLHARLPTWFQQRIILHLQNCTFTCKPWTLKDRPLQWWNLTSRPFKRMASPLPSPSFHVVAAWLSPLYSLQTVRGKTHSFLINTSGPSTVMESLTSQGMKAWEEGTFENTLVGRVVFFTAMWVLQLESSESKQVNFKGNQSDINRFSRALTHFFFWGTSKAVKSVKICVCVCV